MASSFFAVHAHTAHSSMDGMGTAAQMVQRAAEFGQPAIAFSEHGNMASTVQGYLAAKKAGIKYFPACEWYVVSDVTDPEGRKNRWHMGMLALDSIGYQAMTQMQTLSYQEDHFYRKPLLDLGDLADAYDRGWMEHVAVLTGCYSGMVIDGWDKPDPEENARKRIRMMKMFCPNLFVELQDHGIVWPNGVSDQEIALALYQIAQEEDLPVVMGGDSHYLDAYQQSTHDLMKDICYFGDGEDNHFSGGPYHLPSTEESKAKWPEDVWTSIEDGHRRLLDMHEDAIPPLDNYEFHVPVMERVNPDQVLEDEVMEGLDARGKQTIDYLGRASDELKVIAKMGMSNYFLLVKRHIADWCRDNDIIINTRGSANGSLVCYALGISEVDPLQWNTPFDRFLSLDRMKPPDIDVDVDFRGRQALIEHLSKVFPEITQIATYSKIGMGKNKDTGEDSGSVIVQYMAAMSRKDPDFDRKIKPEHKTALFDLADTHVFKSMGTNAAGFIIPGENLAIEDWLPKARVISSDTWVTQYSKDDVEALGYVKVDVLGLRALQTLNGTLAKIGRPVNDWDWIPMDDKEACALLRSGKTAGIFQYEGFTSAKGGREMKIRTTKDAILGLALYRPALINGGQKDLFLENRKYKTAKRQVRLHTLFDPTLNDTEGVPLFQEQIMGMLRALGMEYQDYNDLMSAIKASNGFIQGAAETFNRIMPIFYDLCEDKGLTDEEADEAWGAVIGFTEYGFNRAHATSYGLMAYRAAYLKAHYPLEYMASLLDVWSDDKDKVRTYAAHARSLGMSIVKADVNHSKAGWDIDTTRRNALRKGLVSLPGIQYPTASVIVEAREEGGDFTSIQDFIDRTPRRPVTGGNDWKRKQELKGVCKVLYEAGAFRSCHDYS